MNEVSHWLDQIWYKILIYIYDLDANERVPPPVTHSSEYPPSRRLQRTHAMLGAFFGIISVFNVFWPRSLRLTDVTQELVPRLRPVPQARKTTSVLLMKLDSRMRPGITEAEFRTLFVKCQRCGLITTWRAFRLHGCATAAMEVIDLTDMWLGG
jgi:hypothetical protein